MKSEEKLEILNFRKFSPGSLIGLPIRQKGRRMGLRHGASERGPRGAERDGEMPDPAVAGALFPFFGK